MFNAPRQRSIAAVRLDDADRANLVALNRALAAMVASGDLPHVARLSTSGTLKAALRIAVDSLKPVRG